MDIFMYRQLQTGTHISFSKRSQIDFQPITEDLPGRPQLGSDETERNLISIHTCSNYMYHCIILINRLIENILEHHDEAKPY